MLTIKIEEIEHSGLKELLGFTEKGTSFLHLSEEDFVNARKIGTEEQIDEITREYYAHLKKIEDNRTRLLACKQRRENRHKPKKRN